LRGTLQFEGRQRPLDNQLGFGTLFVLGAESLPAAPVFASKGLMAGRCYSFAGPLRKPVVGIPRFTTWI